MAEHQPTADSTRRQNWAHLENQRRQQAYRRAHHAWERDARLLDWMLATAQRGPGFHLDQLDTRFEAKRGEAVYGAFQGCQLINVQRGANYQSGHAGFSFPVSRSVSGGPGRLRGGPVPGMEQLRIAGDGEVIITNKRIIFRDGLKSREWTVSKLVGIRHDTALPFTMIGVSNRKQLSGIAYSPEQAPQVRFALEFAGSTEPGTRHALIAAIQADRATIARQRPVPPPLATPEEAPSRVAGIGNGLGRLLTGKPDQSRRRRILHTAVAGGVVLILGNLGIGALAQSGASAPVPAVPSASTVLVSPSASPSATRQPSASPTTRLTATPSPTAPSTPPTSAPPTTTTSSPPVTPTAELPQPIPTPTPTTRPDKVIKKFKIGPKPAPPKLLATKGTSVRVGATCRDGSHSDATGRGACSWHGGVEKWLYEQPAWVDKNKAKNAKLTKSYKAALKTWTAKNKKNELLAKYPCSKGPYKKGSPGYASWRDTNHNGIACDR